MMRDTALRRLLRLMFRVTAYRPPAVAVPRQGITLSGVTVVNPGEGRRAGQTLVVDGERITRLFPGESHDRAGLADESYAGTYVLPGLVEMHAHIPPHERALVNLLFLAHGVTTVRETGDADGTTWKGRWRIQAGKVPGPRLFASGPVLDGAPPYLPTSWVVRDATEARDAVATLAGRGADFVKIHHRLSTEALAGIREAAAEVGLRVVGHIPIAVPFEEAHVWDVQHLDGLVPYPQPPEGPIDYQRRWRDLDPARIAFYVRTSLEQGLVHTPTLASFDSLVRLAEGVPQDDPAVGLLPRYYRVVVWDPKISPFPLGNVTPELRELLQQGLERGQAVVGELHRAGVRLHLGTDTAAMPLVVPGASLQRELGLMVGAGLSLEAAWAAGTRAAGESLGLPLLGTVQEGAPADLLVFAQDPTRDLSALSTLQAVVAQGRLYPKTYLDEALARHRERFERPFYDRRMAAVIRLGMKGMARRN